MRQLLAFIPFIFIFSSCTDKSKNDITIFRATDEGLQQSIEVISRSNKTIYSSLEDRLTNPGSNVYAAIWQPKALKVKSLTDAIVTYIRQLKEELKDEAGFSNALDRESFREDNVPTVNHFFNEHNKGTALFNQLMNYREQVLEVDSQLTQVFKNNMMIFAKGANYANDDSVVFTRSFFNDIPVIAACAMLSKLENNIRVIEYNFINYCHARSFSSHGNIHDHMQPVVMQNSGCVKGGELIEITAGVGIFTGMTNTGISVNGKSIPVEYGVGTYKFKAPLQAGKYTVPVKIDFIDPNGNKLTMVKKITYAVIGDQ